MTLRIDNIDCYYGHVQVLRGVSFELAPGEVLHVGDSDVDDVIGAKAAGMRVAWLNRTGRSRRPDVPVPDAEISDLTGLLSLL